MEVVVVPMLLPLARAVTPRKMEEGLTERPKKPLVDRAPWRELLQANADDIGPVDEAAARTVTMARRVNAFHILQGFG
jgi:hypothetical protein